MFFIAFLRQIIFLFFLLNNSFAEDLLCFDCCYKEFYDDYEDGKDFSNNGLDVYVIDDFIPNGINIFDTYYSSFFDEKIEKLLTKEKINKNKFLANVNLSKELHFANHKNPWYFNIYSKRHDDNNNKNLIVDIAKKMSTEGGNNFDWEEGVDKPRPNEASLSKERHNKNVIIVKLKNEKDTLFKNTIYTFRKFVNMSYCPLPIIFTGNFKYKNFERDLKNINEAYTEEFGKNQSRDIRKGIVDHRQEISEGNCFYIEQNADFEKNVKEKLRLAANFHNSKVNNFNGETFNVAVVGWKRSGKTTLANIILDSLCGKASNDFASVTRHQTKFFHKNIDKIPIAIIDTPGFEVKKDYAKDFETWLQEPCKEDPSKANSDNIHLIIYVINAQNFPQPEKFGEKWYDSDGNKMGNELFTEGEVNLLKVLKEKNIPVVFNIARSGSFKNGYKYLRKFFGDLILINELSNFNSDDQSWKNCKQWFSLNSIRSNLIQLKDDYIEEKNEYTGKYGLYRLTNLICDLYQSNNEYKKRLPISFQNNKKLIEMFDSLKKQFITQGFKNDEEEKPLVVRNKDLISKIFEAGLISSLETLHKNREITSSKIAWAKEILNYVCAYDYYVDKTKIANEVTDKILKNHSFISTANQFSKMRVLGFFVNFATKAITHQEGNIEQVIKNMIENSLPKIIL